MSDYDVLGTAEVRAWQEGFTSTPGLLETVANWVGIDQLLVALGFLWPTFLRVEDCVLLPWEYSEESFEAWWAELSGNRRRIEEALNHLHLWDVFDGAEVSGEALMYLGEMMVVVWGAALKEQIPERDFEVRFSNKSDDYGPTISIHSL